MQRSGKQTGGGQTEFGFASEDGKFSKRSAAKAGRAQGYCRCLGRAEPSGLLQGLGRYAEHRAILLWLGRGEASRPSPPVSDGFRLRNETKRSVGRRAEVAWSRAEKLSEAV